jgi:isocitrate lyase
MMTTQPLYPFEQSAKWSSITKSGPTADVIKEKTVTKPKSKEQDNFIKPTYDVTREEAAAIENIFTYHAPKGNQGQRYAKLRVEALYLANMILQSCPACHERVLAVERLRECIMWANSSIAIHE